jgi:hypothetical protein
MVYPEEIVGEQSQGCQGPEPPSIHNAIRRTQIRPTTKDQKTDITIPSERDFAQDIHASPQKMEFPFVAELLREEQGDSNGIDDDLEDSITATLVSRQQEQRQEEKMLNQTYSPVQPIWTRIPDDINHNEYGQFYNMLTKRRQNDYMFVKHFTSRESKAEFHTILFIPSVFSESKKKNENIRFYVRGAYITRKAKLLPEFLCFIEGIVDCENMKIYCGKSETTSEQFDFLEDIRHILIEKCLEMFVEMAQNKGCFQNFYDKFGKFLDLGIQEESIIKTRLAELVNKTVNHHEAQIAIDPLNDEPPKKRSKRYIMDTRYAVYSHTPYAQGGQKILMRKRQSERIAKTRENNAAVSVDLTDNSAASESSSDKQVFKLGEPNVFIEFIPSNYAKSKKRQILNVKGHKYFLPIKNRFTYLCVMNNNMNCPAKAKVQGTSVYLEHLHCHGVTTDNNPKYKCLRCGGMFWTPEKLAAHKTSAHKAMVSLHIRCGGLKLDLTNY